jgi:hypothetical protein
MITLRELSEASGVQEIAPGRTVGEQVYDSSINTVSQDTDLGSDTYTGSITPYSDNVDPFFSGLQTITQPVGSFLNKYGAPLVGGVMSLVSGIPGLGFLANRLSPKPYDQNLLNMYGGYGPDGRQDKFGYNVVSMADNYMTPGSNSFRSHALEGLGGLTQNLANDFYQQNYGLTFDQVKSAIQQKEDPFNSAGIVDMGADYQGSGDNQSFNEGPVGNNAGGAQLGSGMSTGQHGAFRN